MSNFPVIAILESAVIAGLSFYFIVQFRKKSSVTAKGKDNDPVASALMDELMQNGITYNDVVNIDNIRDADPINAPALDMISFNGDVMRFQSKLVSNIEDSFKLPHQTADQAIVGYYQPNQRELDQTEYYVRNY